MEMAKSLMDALKGKAGGGGGAPPPGGGAGQPQEPFDPNKSPALADLFGGASSTAANFLGDAAENISNAASNIFNSVFGGGEEVPPPPPAEEEQRPATGDIEIETETGTKTGGGRIIRGGEEGPPGQGPLVGGIAGFFSRFFDIDEQRGRIAEGQSFFRRLCASRPWQATFVARVFSAGFFDSLCAEQGNNAVGNQFVFDPNNQAARYARLLCPNKVKLNEGATISWDCGGSTSAGFGFDTGGHAAGSVTIQPQDIDDYFLRCGNGGRAQCTIDVIRPRAQITAYPSHVQLGARSEVFWTSENSVECTIEGPGFKELGTRGAATTPVILESVTYAITCSDEEGLRARDTVVIGVGDN